MKVSHVRLFMGWVGLSLGSTHTRTWPSWSGGSNFNPSPTRMGDRIKQIRLSMGRGWFSWLWRSGKWWRCDKMMVEINKNQVRSHQIQWRSRRKWLRYPRIYQNSLEMVVYHSQVKWIGFWKRRPTTLPACQCWSRKEGTHLWLSE